MGRKIKYKTEEEKIQARKDRQMKYYWKNQDRLKTNALKRYHDRKKQNENNR
jgi:hypothetical protein